MIEDIGRGIKYNVLGNIIAISAGLLASILILRGIGKEEYGYFIFVTSIFAFLSPIYDLGLTVPLTRYISEYRTKNELGKIRTLILKSLKFKLINWIIISPIVLYIWQYLYPGTLSIALMLVFTALLTTIDGTFSSNLQSFYEQKILGIVSIIKNIFYLILIYLIVQFMPSIKMVILAGLISLLPEFVLLGRKTKSVIITSSKSIKEDERKIAKFAMAGLLSGIISYITYQRSGVVFLGSYRTKDEVASYGLAYDFAQRIPNLISIVIGSLHYVSITELYTKNKDGITYGIRTLEQFIFIVSMPICAWSLVEAENFINILYGPVMLDAVFPFRVLLVVIFLNIAVYPINAVIVALEEQPFATAIGAIFALIQIFLYILLIPKYGINGVLFAVCFTLISGLFIWIPWTYKKIGDFFPIKNFIKISISILPMTLILILTERICANIGALIIVALISFILYIFMLRVTKVLSNEDKIILSKMNMPLMKKLIKLL